MKKVSKATSITLLLLVLITGVTLAATIIVDGDRESAWDTEPSANDPNEPEITADGVDVKSVAWTNDAANMYFLIETYDTTIWNLGRRNPFVIICLNIDNDMTTGIASAQCIEGGYDRFIKVAGPNLAITVEDEFMTPIAATTVAATSGVYTEVSIDLPSLGFNSSNCGEVPANVFFDGATGDSDDSLLFFMSCTPPPPPPSEGNIEVACEGVLFTGELSEPGQLEIRLHSGPTFDTPTLQDEIYPLPAGPFNVTIPWVTNPGGLAYRVAIRAGGEIIAVIEDISNCTPPPSPSEGNIEVACEGVLFTGELSEPGQLEIRLHSDPTWDSPTLQDEIYPLPAGPFNVSIPWVTNPDGLAYRVAIRAGGEVISVIEGIGSCPPAPGGEGCTPGYWKQRQHLDSWVSYSPTQNYYTVFGVSESFDTNLLGALKQRGGSEKALQRHAVAALLNTANSSVAYPFTEAEVISMVQSAYATNDFEGIKNILAEGNELGCPLN